ncbi:MAG: alginate export family protein [Verrucomicrobiota bacterium]
MKKTTHNTYKNCTKILTGSAMVLAISASVFAQEKPFSQPGTGQPPAPPAPAKKVAAPATPAATTAAKAAPEPNAVDRFFNGKIPEAFAKGKFNLNARLRYEYADQDGVAAITDPSHAPTIRTRFGFTTAPVYGFQGMIEGEDIRVLGPEGNYNAAGSNNKNYKPVVADPPTTELNQAWLSYSYTNLLTIKGGRERLAFDNHRFIGDVGWRQNMQTFDAAGIELKPINGLSLNYDYVWDVRRVFGDVSGLPAASPNHDFQSSSHLINVAYAPCEYVRAVGYAYLLDLDLQNGTATANNSSCATYGGYLAGSAPVTEKLSLAYRGEFAWQTEYADSTLDYDAKYYNLELSGNIQPFAFGAGYEVLGSGSNGGVGGGRTAFRTPLATLHAFNGWADVFLNTPNNGLRDLYAFAQVTLPYQMPLRFVYHKFESDSGSGDYGNEFDAVLSKKFGKNWTALVKYAYYAGEDAAVPALTVSNVDVQKFWAQVEFNF